MRTTKLASYLLATAVMAVSPFTAFATESAGTGGMTFYDYLASNADKDTAIDFNEAPTTGNETVDVYGYTIPVSDIGGLYMLQDTKDDENPMYFYRGNVENNNVLFNDMCWLIVRTTETGGTKLLYNGAPDGEGVCIGNDGIDYSTIQNISEYNTLIGGSVFSEYYNAPSDMGFMYGERFVAEEHQLSGRTVFGNDVEYENGEYRLVGTVSIPYNNWNNEYDRMLNGHHYTCLSTETTCSKVYYAVYHRITTHVTAIELTDGETLDSILPKSFENTNDSTVKTLLDAWYAENMINVTDSLEDTVWYAGKPFGSGALSSKDSDFNSDFDENGFSYTQTMIDALWNGATREGQSTLPLLRTPDIDNNLFDFSLLDSKQTNDYFEDTQGDISETDYLKADETNNVPSFNYDDYYGKYTVNKENGNGALTYPVGMLTVSEILLAGNHYESLLKGTYIDDNSAWWLITPSRFSLGTSSVGMFHSLLGYMDGMGVRGEMGIRPAISLKSSLGALSGDGSKEHPFSNVTNDLPKEDNSGEDSGETPAEDEATPANPQTSDTLTKVACIILAATTSAYIIGRKLSRR